MPPIDPTKVQSKLNELNKPGQPGAGFWIPSDGINALTTVTFQTAIPQFNPNIGIPIKVFVNTQSGEVKIFDARLFTQKTT